MNNNELKAKYEGLFKDSDIFKVEDVTDVNHRPHPFTIGPKHIEHAQQLGCVLGDATLRAVPCAAYQCNLSYDEHTSDKVLMLSLKCNCEQEQVNDELNDVVKEVAADGIDGFSFLETPEKFRVKPAKG
jgi:glycosidase